MPFKSEAQRRYLYANHPDIAKRWSEEYPHQGKLPGHVSKKKKSKKHHKKANSLLDGPLSHLVKQAEEKESGPPNYHIVPNQMGGPSCSSCQHFDKIGTCLMYNVPVEPNGVCDKFEPTELNTSKIMNAAPVKPATDFSHLKLSSYVKQAREPRPDRMTEMNDWMREVSHHPTTTSGSMITPMKTWLGPGHESHGDVAKRNREKAEAAMSQKQAFKAGFLLKCVESGFTLDQLEKSVEQLLEKKAVDPVGWGSGLLGSLLGTGTGVAHSVANRGIDIGTGVAIGGPLVAGGLLGYGASKLKKGEDPEDIKHDELRSEYQRLANAARRRTQIKRLQDENPGSIVQIA